MEKNWCRLPPCPEAASTFLLQSSSREEGSDSRLTPSSNFFFRLTISRICVVMNMENKIRQIRYKYVTISCVNAYLHAVFSACLHLLCCGFHVNLHGKKYTIGNLLLTLNILTWLRGQENKTKQMKSVPSTNS